MARITLLSFAVDSLGRFAEWSAALANDPRRRRRWAAATIALGLAVFAIFHARIYNSFAGPFDIEARDLAKINDVPNKRFVRVVENGKPLHYTELEDAGFVEQRVSRGRIETEATYRRLREGGDWILVRVADNSANPEVIGLITIAEGELAGKAHTGKVGRNPMLLDCDKSNYRLWSLIAAAFGVLCVLLGLDQLRRAGKKPRTGGMRIFT